MSLKTIFYIFQKFDKTIWGLLDLKSGSVRDYIQATTLST